MLIACCTLLLRVFLLDAACETVLIGVLDVDVVVVVLLLLVVVR